MHWNDELLHLRLKSEDKFYFKKVCVLDRFIAALNAGKDKYLNYETGTSGNIIGNVRVVCHNSERLDSFRVPNKFNVTAGKYLRVAFPEKLVLRDDVRLKLIVED